MKATLFVVAFLLSSIFTFGQDYKIVRKVVTILPEQDFYLNGGVRADFGGKSRVSYKIDLPLNTIGWVYSFTTSINPKSTDNLKLAAQLTKLIDQTGAMAIATEAILAPTGVASADIYLCDRQNIGLFMEKLDKFDWKISGSRQNFKQGVVPIKIEKQGTWYLGIRNPSAVDGINVKLEVVAVVEERVPIIKTETQTKAELYCNMGWNAYLQNDYTKCIELSKKALEYDSTSPPVKCNIALCYLVQNKAECLDSYVDAIAACKKSSQPKEYLQAALKDINDALGKTPDLSNANDIITLLKQELDSQ